MNAKAAKSLEDDQSLTPTSRKAAQHLGANNESAELEAKLFASLALQDELREQLLVLENSLEDEQSAKQQALTQLSQSKREALTLELEKSPRKADSGSANSTPQRTPRLLTPKSSLMNFSIEELSAHVQELEFDLWATEDALEGELVQRKKDELELQLFKQQMAAEKEDLERRIMMTGMELAASKQAVSALQAADEVRRASCKQCIEVVCQAWRARCDGLVNSQQSTLPGD